MVFEGAGLAGPHCHALPVYDLPCETGVFLAGRLRSPVGLGRARVYIPVSLAWIIMFFLYLWFYVFINSVASSPSGGLVGRV